MSRSTREQLQKKMQARKEEEAKKREEERVEKELQEREAERQRQEKMREERERQQEKLRRLSGTADNGLDGKLLSLHYYSTLYYLYTNYVYLYEGNVIYNYLREIIAVIDMVIIVVQ